jgi:uncharacterized protein (UPF0248 family)
MQTAFNNVLNKVGKLPLQQQETLVEIVRHRVIEERRKEIAENAVAAISTFRAGKAQSGSVIDLRKALGK